MQLMKRLMVQETIFYVFENGAPSLVSQSIVKGIQDLTALPFMMISRSNTSISDDNFQWTRSRYMWIKTGNKETIRSEITGKDSL